MKKKQRTLINFIIIIFGLLCLCSISIVYIYSKGNHSVNAQSGLPGIGELAEYSYPVNGNGETYGIDWHGDRYDENAPDLIKAVGENGVEGYVRRSDLEDEGDFVNSPDEAVAYSEKIKTLQLEGKNRTVNLYDKEGKVILDEFKIYY